MDGPIFWQVILSEVNKALGMRRVAQEDKFQDDGREVRLHSK